MRATREDFRKVFDVVREQIEKALSSDRPKTFDQFRNQVDLGAKSEEFVVSVADPG
jgi:hypothetical protein